MDVFQNRLVTVAELENRRAQDASLFEGVELIEGRLTRRAPETARQSRTVTNLFLLFSAFLKGQTVMSGFSVQIDDSTLLQIDFVVMKTLAPPLTDQDYVSPEDIQLAIEVVEGIVAEDVQQRTQLFAKAQIPEYWCINLSDQSLSTYQHPDANGYSQTTQYTSFSDTITPIGIPSAQIEIRELFP